MAHPSTKLATMILPADEKSQDSHNPVFSGDPLQLLPKALTKLYSIWLRLTYPFPAHPKNLSAHFSCSVRRSAAHLIKLGASVRIGKGATLTVLTPNTPTGEPVMIIDDYTHIGIQCVVSAKCNVHVERDVIMAQSVFIADNDSVRDHAIQPHCDTGCSGGGRIRIGHGCWIGHRAVIVCTEGELVLGHNCVVGANAVVTQSYPPHSVIFGNPAMVIRQFDPVRRKWVTGTASPVRHERAK